MTNCWETPPQFQIWITLRCLLKSCTSVSQLVAISLLESILVFFILFTCKFCPVSELVAVCLPRINIFVTSSPAKQSSFHRREKTLCNSAWSMSKWVTVDKWHVCVCVCLCMCSYACIWPRFPFIFALFHCVSLEAQVGNVIGLLTHAIAHRHTDTHTLTHSLNHSLTFALSLAHLLVSMPSSHQNALARKQRLLLWMTLINQLHNREYEWKLWWSSWMSWLIISSTRSFFWEGSLHFSQITAYTLYSLCWIASQIHPVGDSE